MKRVLVPFLAAMAACSQAVVLYSSIAGPYSTLAAGSGTLGRDDYVAATGASQIRLSSMRFIGGVQQVLGGLDFIFFDSTGTTVVNSFSAALPAAGNFTWSILLGSPVLIDSAGVLEIRTRGNTTGQWFLTATAPSVGTNNLAFGGVPGQLYQAFELSGDPVNPVPEPFTMALGAAALATGALRRRRRA